MQLVRSYVVRIYRSGRAGVAGVVEDVKTNRSWSFHSITELWEALCPRAEREGSERPAPPDNPLAD